MTLALCWWCKSSYFIRISHSQSYIIYIACLQVFTCLSELLCLSSFIGAQALQQLREKALKRAKLNEDEVLQKIEERNSARKNKEYEKSDGIRKELAALGIALMDSPQGTSWRPAVPLALQEQLASSAPWVSLPAHKDKNIFL